MIRKVIGCTFFVLLMFSLSLYLNGVTHVDLGYTFLAFMRKCSLELSNFKMSIPDIPMIPVNDVIDFDGDGVAILEAFVNFAKGFFDFINYLTRMLNFIILIFNSVIELLEFTFIVLKNFIWMKGQIVEISQA